MSVGPIQKSLVYKGTSTSAPSIPSSRRRASIPPSSSMHFSQAALAEIARLREENRGLQLALHTSHMLRMEGHRQIARLESELLDAQKVIQSFQKIMVPATEKMQAFEEEIRGVKQELERIKNIHPEGDKTIFDQRKQMRRFSLT
jgi:chromosome segregation ATPase